jgi:hypothetical protein
MAIDISSPRTRRALLTAGFGAVAATVASAIGRVTPVLADGGPVVLGASNSGTNSTGINTAGVAAFKGFSDTSYGLVGESQSGTGVSAGSLSGTALSAGSETGVGIYGTSGSGPGVIGRSDVGRGGIFRGKQAQVRLDPSTASSHPHSGSRGDLFVDKSGRLWFCKGGTTWTKLA